jgi:hypothetical protein
MHRPSLPQRLFLVLSSITGWVDPRVTVRPERSCQWKIPVTPSTIDPATFRLVAQWLNQPRHRVSHVINDTPAILTRPRKKSHGSTPSSFHWNALRLCCVFSVYITNRASQRDHGKGPLVVGDNEVRCFPYLAYRLRLQPPLRYISFPQLGGYHVIITANTRTYRMTRREQGVEARHVAIQSNLASPPRTHLCSFAYLQWASTVQFQLSGLVTLMASWEKILLWESHILSVHQARVRVL